MGPNVAGKTTTFNIIMGFVRPDEGEIKLNGQTITDLPTYKKARLGISYLPQESSVFQGLSVEDNIKAVLQIRKLSTLKQLEIADSLLDMFGLHSIRQQVASTLSGGEKRRLEVARTLACAPAFILLDEPFTGVDPLAISDFQEVVRGLREDNIGVFITDHNVVDTLQICDRAYILFQGEVIASGSPEQLVDNQVVKRLYLGEKYKKLF